MIWRNQILMDTEDGSLILLTTYGYNNKIHDQTLDYLSETFSYLRNPRNPIYGAIRGRGEWIDKPEESKP